VKQDYRVVNETDVGDLGHPLPQWVVDEQGSLGGRTNDPDSRDRAGLKRGR